MSALELEFWGVRGTFPVSNPRMEKYGGQTICASVLSNAGEVIIVDAGTGIRNLGNRLLVENTGSSFHLHLFLTHFHLDHVMGLPYFGPLFSPRATITFYAPTEIPETQRYLEGLMSGRYFPVDFFETKSKKIFKKIEHEIIVSGMVISSCPLQHPQGSVAYRFQSGDASVVFATDTEHPLKGVDERLRDFSRGATCLIYDATFTLEEYEAGRRGWGHSTWAEGVKIAREAAVEHLCLSHLNPDHTDALVEKIAALAQEKLPDSFVARAGLKKTWG